ncbi:MAG: glucosaminidase domain-containing protein [Prolixibacteraceae bacterium]|jgi:Bax protein|nr:glucosaminidase domain-containing protein [Prolixibacteraceae bacterium]
MRKTEISFLIITFLIIAFALMSKMDKQLELNIEYTHLDSIEKVIPITDSLVVPILYDSLIVDRFATIDVRKEQFINQVLPSILIVRFQMENQSRKVKRIINRIESGKELRSNEINFTDSLMKRFRVSSLENLLKGMKPHQTSLVLAQAAVESGWGSSRFAIEGNNLFGIWTTANDPNVIKSLYDREEQSIYVKKYPNISESISHYFLTLGRHNAYKKFRAKRYEEKDVFELIEALNKYSERGYEYTSLLKKIVEWNDLQKYDNYRIDPTYISEKNAIQQLLKNY